MKHYIKAVALAGIALALGISARAADQPNVIGKWKAEFESQIGTQKYTFEFKTEDGKLTGKAVGIRDDATNEVALADVKLKDDQISFAEPLRIQDNDVRVEYSGKVAGDEMKLHRKVGEFAEYDITAKRVKDSDAKPQAESKPAAGSPAKP